MIPIIPRSRVLRLRFVNHEVMECISPGRKSGDGWSLAPLVLKGRHESKHQKHAVLSALTVILAPPVHGLASMATCRAFSTKNAQLQDSRVGLPVK